jgi:site-specific recombinase XerD
MGMEPFELGETFGFYYCKSNGDTVKEAKLENHRLHLHSLRHTFASWLVQDGVSLYEVQKLLGHSSIAVTEIYSHLQPEQLHETVNRLKVSLN